MDPQKGNFWDHLEVLRGVLIRSFIAVFVVAIVVFLLKNFVFEEIIFAPTNSDFPTFRLFNFFTSILGVSDGSILVEPVKVISTRLAGQFFMHMSISFYVALVICVPYITGEIWIFIRPALYQNEKKYISKALIFTGILFYLGVITAYYLIFPLSVNFLASYQVMPDIENLISIDSYIDTLVELCLATGISFELPIATYFLAKIGILKYKFMQTHRKHAFVLVLIISAIITPSTDVFTMFLTAFPLYLIFELSVWVVKKVEKKE
ncbi:MAG: twin-arginine translocase subunit TatC [Bacteroidales bacterium]|nr:twin-arginine translocase subunit TatC [Bacteroidales bacterium]